MAPVIGSRVFVQRRRSLWERLFTLPWRPLVAWVPHEPIGYAKGIRIDADGLSATIVLSSATPGDEQG